jgi:hypothetical protein
VPLLKPGWFTAGWIAALVSCSPLQAKGPVAAETALRCRAFAAEAAPSARPREAVSAVRSFERIKAAVRAEPYRVLFLGDSLTERFDPLVWHEHMAPRGALNAGVSGDRSENLLWRLKHGNLDGPPPAGIVVLIGTNDLTYAGGRSPELAAEGIRANLLYCADACRTPASCCSAYCRAAGRPTARCGKRR